MNEIQIDGRLIGLAHSTYFIADIGANHDGDLERAKDLIHQCADAGANAAKFQHFSAETIVSDHGFRSLGEQRSHQAKWKKGIFEVYQAASLNRDWTPILKETCDKAGVTFFTSPYSFELVDAVDPYVPAYKVGSGDITWFEIIDYMAQKRKPVLLGTGAATLDEVVAAMDCVLKRTREVVLMQCNTNYTASLENFKFIHLAVLKSYAGMFPGTILGLSDHTPGHATALGAVALGARVIEKHFTDDVKREGPDHGFSMDPKAWREMVNRTRELEASLGSAIKKVADNERETVVLQRRCIRARIDLPTNIELNRQHLEMLRPCPIDALPPYRLEQVIGQKLARTLKAGEHLRWRDLV